MQATIRQRFPQWGHPDSRLIRAALRHYIACPDGNQHVDAELPWYVPAPDAPPTGR
jgi:hypothetical protein